jgi:hypothetical protein
MSDLQVSAWQAKVRQVRRRQIAQKFLRRLPAWLIGAILTAGAMYVVLPYLPWTIDWWLPLAILLPASAAVALGWVLYRNPSPVNAAMALDDAFGLQERVTTVVSLKAELRSTEAAQALLADTAQHINKVDVQSRFPLQLTRDAASVPAALAVFALLVWLYQPAVTNLVKAGDGEQQLVTEKPPPEETKEVKKHNEERKKMAKALNSEKFEQLLADLEKLTKEMEKAETKPEAQQPAIQEMTKLSDNIRKRQEELGKAHDIQQKLREDMDLKKFEDGPGKDFQKALSKGDMKQAMEELAKLAQDLKDGNLSEAEKKALAKQLKDLKQKLKDIAEQKARKEAIAKSDADPETKQKEMEKVEKESQNLEALAHLAESLNDDALKQLAEGDPQQAMQMMKDAMAQLDDLEKSEDENAELAEMLADIDKLKQCLG